MKLSKELISSGLLGRHQVKHSVEWDLDERRGPRMPAIDPVERVMHYRRRSIKVSPRGWRVLLDVLCTRQ